jgi:hypothetical protein
MNDQRYNTGMAAEFYVLSMLRRLGVNALITLGNQKAVDILVEKDGKTLTIDVKGLAGKDAFPVANYTAKPDHYLVFVCFMGRITDPEALPTVFIVPSMDLVKERKELKDYEGKTLLYKAPGSRGKTVQYNRLTKLPQYRDNWGAFRT